ncbi:MAG: peptidoglycan DD-metalloendopeptidase family protein [Cytophagales bacterium]|nr:peptidoglycan DD-metalloendopeptidase family protein [Hyphobacterium sp. CCMP332]
MARIKYYYDTESCKYERIKVSKGDIFINFLGFLFLGVIIAVGLLFVYFTNFDSPKEALLKKENKELLLKYDLLSKELNQVENILTALQDRDDDIYRTIFEANPIPESVREAGVGGANKYQALMEEDLEQETLILSTFQKIDKIKKKMYIQSKSYDEILKMANDKAKMLASIPAIQPISNKELKRLASGYGMRIHPIYKVRKMHTGVDFSAERGTPIYATGDGIVRRATYSLGGYGRQVEINHGYGYVTKYAHMSKFIVKKGQKVKRGEIIGYVGSTGTSVAPHLHYEVIRNKKKVNPVHYFFNDLSAEEYEEILKLSSVENQSLS